MDAEARGHRTSDGSSASASSPIVQHNHQCGVGAFEQRNGRRYLRNLPYPLPVDLAELQRQSIRTMLLCEVFGRVVCSPLARDDPPCRVLEVACGSGSWSAMCHDFFSALGHDDISFTGIDVVPLAPDLRRNGVDWTFVQHDLRRRPWPFDEGEFDFVMLKDTSLLVPLGTSSERIVEESIRVLKPGGTLELWEADHVLRCLTPDPPTPAFSKDELDVAMRTATYLTSPGTPFALAENEYLRESNEWISELLDDNEMPSAPCSRIGPLLFQEPDKLGEIGSRRIAIPLAELQWERDNDSSDTDVCNNRHSRTPSDAQDSLLSSRSSRSMLHHELSPEQAALRYAAMLTHLQKIESLEPSLREISGKNAEEWAHWWSSMMTDLLSPSPPLLAGECLEIGAWWATKLDD